MKNVELARGTRPEKKVLKTYNKTTTKTRCCCTDEHARTIDEITDIIQLLLELDESDRDRMRARAEILLEEPKYFRRKFKLLT